MSPWSFCSRPRSRRMLLNFGMPEFMHPAGNCQPGSVLKKHFGKTCEAALIILQKYLLREWSRTFAAVSAVMLVVMFGMTIGELLNDIAKGRVPPGLLGEMLLLNMPDVLNMILPLGVFVAVIWVLGRFHRDQEMTVMRASGFNWQMMLRPLFNLLLPVAVIVFVIGVFVAPSAAQMAQQKLEKAFRTAAEWGLQTGQFHELQNGNVILYVEAVEKDGRTLRNIFIQQRDAEREQIWIAETGYYWLDADNGVRYLTLENGQITEGGQETLDFRIVQFSRNDLRLPEPEYKSSAPDIDSRPSMDLIFSSLPQEAAEIQWRISPAIGIIVLGLLAMPLSHSAPKEGRGGRVVLGVFAYTIYANVLYMDRSWIASGIVPPSLGLWWIHLLTLVVAFYWLRLQGKLVS